MVFVEMERLRRGDAVVMEINKPPEGGLWNDDKTAKDR